MSMAADGYKIQARFFHALSHPVRLRIVSLLARREACVCHLTAILGNVQLLLMNNKNLDDELKAKLKTVEKSALKIKDVVQRLLNVSSPRSVEYTEGTNMLDLSDKDEEEDKE